MNKTGISWCDYTWNVAHGCSRVSEACDHCYARRLAETRLRGRYGYLEPYPFQVQCFPTRLKEPHKLRRPSRIFVASMGDLFHPHVPREFVHDVFDVMHTCHWHTFYCLTKRPARIWDVLNGLPESFFGKYFSDNIWLGATIEYDAYRRRAEPLQQLAELGWHTFVSVEPMLEPIDLSQYLARDGKPGIQWVICGGERAGLDSRPMRLEWAQALLNQCRAAGVPFHFKHEGDWWWRHRGDLPTPEVVVDVREWPR